MRNRTKLFAASLAAATLMALAVGAASANRLSTTSQSFKVTWSPLALSATGGLFTIRCPVTIEGSYHSATITKTERILVGLVNRATANAGACSGGTASVLQETLPWHVKYMSFEGTLPRITGVRVLLAGMSINLTAAGLTCRATSEANNPAGGVITRETGTGRITGLRADETLAIPITGSFCPASANFSGTGTVTSGSGGAVTVTLI